MRLIDSSVIVKFFAEEPGWGSLREYLYTPISIELSMKELGSALLKKVRQKGMERQTAMEILARCPKIFRFLEQKKHLNGAFEIAQKYDTSIYDSLFIAVALKEGYELVTCDGYQADIARKVGVRVIEH